MTVRWVVIVGCLFLVGCGSGDASGSRRSSGGSAGSGASGGSGGWMGGSAGSGGSAGDGGDPCSICHPSSTCDLSGAQPVCRCAAGFQQNGGPESPCEDVDECSLGTDNCDPAATCTNTPGSFTCTCAAGVNCGCDLTGTFAVRTEMDVAWDTVTVGTVTVITGGSDTLVVWQIRDQVQTGSSLTVSTTPCGSTSPDLCSPLFNGQAYSQVLPDNIWQLPSMPVYESTVTLGNTNAGDPFVGANEVWLLGLDLADPTGSWPASYTDSRITWLDHDADGPVGVTSALRNTGTSVACGGLPYAYLPDPANPLGRRIAKVQGGSRALATYNGALIDCNTLSGNVTGPGTGGLPLLNAHVHGCVLEDGSACPASTVTAADDQGQQTSQRVVAARFSMVRVSADITCATVRGMTFP